MSPAVELDCKACPTPHDVCEFTACRICAACPTARAKRDERAAAVLAYQRQTFSAKARGW